ncbi:MAG TPA: hypothetical protein VKR22_03550 [Acidimicrobiales bacterium]|nr:hypothetical protein [Acidimicrobiales bacterium]
MARRWRRPRWRRALGRRAARVALPVVVVAVVIGFAAGGVAQIGRASGSYRATLNLGYAALSAPVARESNATGRSLRSLLGTMATLDRITLFSTLGGLAGATEAEHHGLDALTPPQPASGTASCRSSLAARAEAVASLRDGVESLLGGRAGAAPGDPTSAVSTLEQAGATLSAADGSWAECRYRLRLARGRARLVVSRWVTSPAPWTTTALDRLVAALGRARQLSAHHALGVDAVTTDPSALASGPGGLVPPTTRLTVHAVLVDHGNVDEPAVQVQVNLVPAPGAGTAATETAIVAVDAGRAVAVVLGPFTVQPGASYTVQVTAAPPQGPGGTSTSAPVQVETIPTTTTTTMAPTTTTTKAGRHPGTTGG